MRGKIIAGRYLQERSAEIVIQIYDVPVGELVLGDEVFIGTQAQSAENVSIECESFLDEINFRG